MATRTNGQDLAPNTTKSNGLFNSVQLLKAYENAIDENIISSITDANGTIVHANNKFCKVSKYAEDEVLGQNHRIVNSGYHPPEFFHTMWQTISKGKVWHNEIKNKAKDGSFYWVDTVIVPIKDETERPTHYLSLRTLISERKELEMSKARYVSSLEILLVMTSNNVKKPLADCLKEIDIFHSKNISNKEALNKIVANLKLSASQLDVFTKELATFIREM